MKQIFALSKQITTARREDVALYNKKTTQFITFSSCLKAGSPAPSAYMKVGEPASIGMK